jgi:hypothetical protein
MDFDESRGKEVVDMRKKNYIACFIILAGNTFARETRLEVSLAGKWRFEIGNEKEYSQAGFDDSQWEWGRVPSCWEDFGFPGYDGFAWYRQRFVVPAELQNKSLRLKLGRIDDVDKVYLNSQYVGGLGTVSPDYRTAFDQQRDYYLPNDMVKFGDENVLAVQVFDAGGCGGIYAGEIGIYSEKTVDLILNLAGKWKFTTGDNEKFKEINFNDSKWQMMMVPSTWDANGLADYDGYGWYRKNVHLDEALDTDKLILVLGKIDDMDEVYFNGVRIGRTGVFPGEIYGNANNSYYNQDRYYIIPPYLIKWNAENTIAVRVYDVWNIGGIYEGPIGITTRDQYMRYMKIW